MGQLSVLGWCIWCLLTIFGVGVMCKFIWARFSLWNAHSERFGLFSDGNAHILPLPRLRMGS
jgi:hypothetical protein